MTDEVKIPKWIQHARSIAPRIKVNAKDYDLDPCVVAAIIQKESAYNTFAVRYEPKWKYHFEVAAFAKEVNTSQATEKVMQATSWGLMQIMGTVVREYGYIGPFPQLCLPQVNIPFGCKHLRTMLDRHGEYDLAIASYNAGNPKPFQEGNKTAKKYVSDVLRLAEELKKHGRPVFV